MRNQDPMTAPVGSLLDPIEGIQASNSIAVAVRIMKEGGLGCLAILSGTRYVTMMDESAVVEALEQNIALTNPVTELQCRRAVPLINSDTGANALRSFAQYQVRALPVVDREQNYLGILTPSMLLVVRPLGDRPKMVGGMASPIGVYLTTGGSRGGVPDWALVLTGMQMFTMFVLGSYVGHFAAPYLPLSTRSWAESALALGVFLMGIRLTPLAGYHGAEHMVVHAIEQGEELIPEVVRRMPRVHPRCGTNLAVAASIFLGVFGWKWSQDEEIRLIVAFLATLVLFRPVGSFVQQFITTRVPSDKQLAAGISAGNDLIANAQKSRLVHANLANRLLRSGMIFIMLGSMLVAGLLALTFYVLKVPPEWRVSF